MPTPAGAPPRTGTKSPSPRTSLALSCCIQRPPLPPALSCVFGEPSSSASWPLSASWHGSPASSHCGAGASAQRRRPSPNPRDVAARGGRPPWPPRIPLDPLFTRRIGISPRAVDRPGGRPRTGGAAPRGTPDAPRLRQNLGLRGPVVRAQRVHHAAPVPHRLHGADGLDRGGLHRPGALCLRTLERHGLVPALVRRHSLPRLFPAPAALDLRPGGDAGPCLPWPRIPLRHRDGLLAGPGHALLDGLAALRKARVRARRRHRLLADFAHLPAREPGPLGLGRFLGPAPVDHAGGLG